ncbi:MAG: glycosyltransferase [Rhodocyclaceae bacterium]|jgi:glycosyltransferase involved in cell wall biosynthesis|nr:glycosyltransferase [Rhodocyclaceae bacterium]
MTRILMVSDVYFPRINGVSTSMESFRRCLTAEGVEVRMVVPRYGDEPDQEGIVRVAGRPVPGDPEDRLLRWREMHRTVEREAANCDLVHIQTPFVAHYAGLKAARRHGLPVLATYHTLFEEYLEYYAPFIPASWLKAQARAFSRRQCNALDAVVVPSSAMKQRLESYGVAKLLQVLPTGIPLRQFAAGDGAAFRRLHGIAEERPVALYVGRLAHEKNIAFLFDALTHVRHTLPDALLLVAGEGPAARDLRQNVEAQGLNEAVRFVGYLDRDQALPDCYAAADVFAFASRTETQGLVLLEAMAAGLPVVALSAMGTGDILASGRGCRVAEDDPQAFGETLAHVLGRKALRLQLADHARRHALDWSDQAMAERLATFYRRLIVSRRERAAIVCASETT